MFQHVPTNSPPRYRLPGRRVSFLITNDDTSGRSCTLEVLFAPHAETGPHTHRDHDEQIYVLDGAVTLTIDRATVQAAAGEIVFIPRGVVHTIRGGAAPARLLKTYTPGDIEQDIRRRCGLPPQGESPARGIVGKSAPSASFSAAHDRDRRPVPVHPGRRAAGAGRELG